jgi:RNA polymerase sigma-70 factor (ECF subfamily)
MENFFDDDSYSPPQAALRQEELSELRMHLATLSTSQQELLRMRFAEELPYSQIATRMHKSEGAIRTMLTRTLNLLRNIYSKRREENHHA